MNTPSATGLRATPIVALDFPATRQALEMVRELGDLSRFYKIGSELFAADGPAVVSAVRDLGADVFLDLKFHDIPNTVRGAARSAAALGARLITVHASGGRAMLEAAVAGAREGTGAAGRAVGSAPKACEVFAVTVLTSLDASALSDAWGKPVPNVAAEVLRLAGAAHAAGVPGVVCSGLEAAAVRSTFGDGLALLVPGVRLGGEGERHDQVRVVTPRQAADAGARYVVLGRAVTAAESPRYAMLQVLADLS